MNTERIVLTPAETGELLGIHLNSVYDAVRTGKLPSVRFGRKILIPREALDRLLSVGRETLSKTAA